MRLRHWLWIAGTTLLLIAGLNVAIFSVYPWARWTEDFFPGRAPDDPLEAEAWTVTDDSLTFAVVGDTGTGGRNQMAVAQAMVDAYKTRPYPVVVHVGDISYYGSAADRWDEVVEEPYASLSAAGVEFEVAIGNHELEEEVSPEANQEIVAILERIGEAGHFYSQVYGPVEFFIIDSSTPLITGNAAEDQLEWLEGALAASTAKWKIAVQHHPPYGSGPKRGSNIPVREAVEPLYVEYGVDLVLTGHDHFYERTTPQKGIVYVITGAGAKVSDIGEDADFTAFAREGLQFMIIEVDGNTLRGEALDEDNVVFDNFVITKGAA